MLSILIPVYNRSVVNLIYTLHEQLKIKNLKFEINILDDASTRTSYLEEHQALNDLPFTSFHKLEQNIGRSAIRNKLGKMAKYDWLLFLDANTAITHPNFIETYINYLGPNNTVIFGGISYKKPDNPNYSLRYNYGVQRESKTLIERKKNPYLNFTSKNFCISKSVFLNQLFDENFKTFGYEDTFFALNLKRKGIDIKHINNPIQHIDLDDNLSFLLKIESALKNLIRFKNELNTPSFKLLNYYNILLKTRLVIPLGFLTKCIQKPLEKLICKKNNNLFIFDVYRLLLLCKLTVEKHNSHA
tara:strand:- start:1211 stop:2113 length:903 start_codon:yes stop_codon:yes gene_type:complete